MPTRRKAQLIKFSCAFIPSKLLFAVFGFDRIVYHADKLECASKVLLLVALYPLDGALPGIVLLIYDLNNKSIVAGYAFRVHIKTSHDVLRFKLCQQNFSKHSKKRSQNGYFPPLNYFAAPEHYGNGHIVQKTKNERLQKTKSTSSKRSKNHQIEGLFQSKHH